MIYLSMCSKFNTFTALALCMTSGKSCIYSKKVCLNNKFSPKQRDLKCLYSEFNGQTHFFYCGISLFSRHH